MANAVKIPAGTRLHDPGVRKAIKMDNFCCKIPTRLKRAEPLPVAGCGGNEFIDMSILAPEEGQ